MGAAPLIAVRDLVHSYGEGELRKEILHRVSADFYPGEIVIIVGPSGAGKTTFLTLVGALRAVQEGSVVIEGQELRGASPKTLVNLRRKIGFIFQSHNLIHSLTACQNVQLALYNNAEVTTDTARARAVEALANVGLGEFTERKPRFLSGGQQQRVAIARALVNQPRIILADEPTAALDKQTGREVVDLLHHLAKRVGCAILLVTHDNRILDIADRIITLEDGRLAETHAGMDRIATGLVELSGMLPACIATGQAAQQLAEARRLFREQAEIINQQTADLVHLHLRPALATQVGNLQRILTQTQALEESLASFITLLSGPGSELVLELCDRFLQGFEAVLLTAADAVRSGDVEEIEVVSRMTEDKRDLMDRLRAQYFHHLKELPEPGRDFLFELTNNYARNIYFVHQLAGSWLAWRKNVPA